MYKIGDRFTVRVKYSEDHPLSVGTEVELVAAPVGVNPIFRVVGEVGKYSLSTLDLDPAVNEKTVERVMALFYGRKPGKREMITTLIKEGWIR